MRALAYTCLALSLLQLTLAIFYGPTLGRFTAPRTAALYRQSHDNWWRANDDARQGAIRVTAQDPVAGPSADAVAASAAREDGSASSPIRFRLGIGGIVTAAISLGLLSRTSRTRRPWTIAWFDGPVRSIVLALFVSIMLFANMGNALKSTHPTVWLEINRAFFSHWRFASDIDQVSARENRQFHLLVVDQDVEMRNDLLGDARVTHANAVAMTGHLVTAGNLAIQLGMCAALWRKRATRPHPPTTPPDPPRHTAPAPPPPPHPPQP